MAGTCAVAGNPFSAAVLVDYMESSLSPSTDEAGVALLQTPYEAIALLCHACMLAVGFRLVGLGEDHKLEAHSETDDPKPLPPEWNASSSSYAFRYVHPQSSMEYLVKVTRLGPKAVVFGMGVGDDKTNSFDVAVKDYISESSLPCRRPSIREGENAAERRKTQLQDVFISPGRMADLAALFKLKVIQRVIPGLHKDGYEDETAPSSSAGGDVQSAQPSGTDRIDQPADPLRAGRYPRASPRPLHDPLFTPSRPHPVGDFPPPGFEDEYEMNRPGRHDVGPRRGNPLGIGHDDLYPPGLGPHDPLRGTLIPGQGGLPRPGGGGGGMHPTFDDPLFAGGRPGGDDEGGYDPSRPPGARYDPIGPGDEPPSGLRDGPRFPGGRGGPPNPFGGFGGGAFI